MIFPGHTAMYVAQQLVVNYWIAGVIFCAYRSQSRHSKQRFENILETRNATLEIVHDARGITPLVFHSFKHPAFNLFFPSDGRKVGQRQIVIAFEMRALGHELLATLIVDDLCNRIRELLIFGIPGSRGTNAVTLHHPASAEPEQSSQAPTQRRHLSVRRGTEIRSLKFPGCKQPAVLQQENSVLNQGVVQKKVSQSNRVTALFNKRHGLSPICWRRRGRSGHPALGGIKIPITNVPDVNMTQERVHLRHSCENPHGDQPQNQAAENAPPLHDGKNQHRREDGGDQNQFAVPAHQQLRPVCRLVKRYFAWFVHDQTTAAPTANKPPSKAAAEMMKAIAQTAYTARRANSFHSPPNTSVTPIATKAIIAIAPATGPLNDCCNLVSGCSHGNACPPAAAEAGRLRIADARVSKPV